MEEKNKETKTKNDELRTDIRNIQQQNTLFECMLIEVLETLAALSNTGCAIEQWYILKSYIVQFYLNKINEGFPKEQVSNLFNLR